MMWGFVAGSVVMLTGVIFGALIVDFKGEPKCDCNDDGVKYTPLVATRLEKLAE